MRYSPPNNLSTNRLLKDSIPTLIIEPSRTISQPYNHIPASYDITRVTTLKTAFEQLLDNMPSLVFLSASFSTHKTLDFMNELKMTSRIKLIPLLMVVDLTNRINIIPGTFWGSKFGIVHSLSSKQEVESTLLRVLQN